MADKPKEQPKELKHKTHSAKVKQEKGGDGRKFTFTFSSAEVDRDRDTIDQMGIDLQPFKKNPVVLWAHDYTQPPVARVVDTWFRDDSLMGAIEFPKSGVNAMSDTLRGLVEEGFLQGVSIGFDPVEWTFDEQRGGINYKKIELYELSLVPIPSNRSALIEAAAKGVKIGPVVDWAKSVLGEEEPEKTPPKEPPGDDQSFGLMESAIKEALERFEASIEKKIAEAVDRLPPLPPVSPPKAAPAVPPKAARIPLTDEGREAISAAVLRALKTAADREVNKHTGRLED